MRGWRDSQDRTEPCLSGAVFIGSAAGRWLVA